MPDRGGHITRDCTSKTRCKTEDCGRMHATMLQAANWSKLREQGRRRREQTAGGHNKETSAKEPSTTGSVYHDQGKEDRPRDAPPSHVLNIFFIDIQTSKELIQMDINKKMRNGIFTMNGEHTQSEN